MAYDLYAPRPFFERDHESFRETVRRYVTREIADHVEAWDRDGDIPRSTWHGLGDLGLLGLTLPQHHGGAGADDFRYRCVVVEELARVNASSLVSGLSVHCDIVAPYLVDLATEAQAERWLPPMATGAKIGAIAMTEPGAGSDLRGIRTSARRVEGGWVINGTKTFITSGINADLVIVVARTDPHAGAGSRAFSLFVLERGMQGFGRGRKLEKLGLRAQDTGELRFEDVHVTEEQLLGSEGRGLHALMAHLPLERLSLAVAACAGARAALAWTLEHVRQRRAFGQAVADFQNTRFVVAELATELDVAQSFVDEAVHRLNRGELGATDAAKAKWWATEMHKRVVDRCLQLFGGYGYMLEYPIARAYADARVTTIYGGTTEIMKVLIAREVLG